jgi:hypothetical protein
MKTKKEILAAVNSVAKQYGAEVHWGTEDGITWLTIYGGTINPKIFDEVTRNISQQTGVDAYFNKCQIDSVEMAFNARMNYTEDDKVPEGYDVKHIDDYGTVFK